MHPRGAVGLAVLALLAGEGRARAQACCASTSAIFPARLADGEDGLVGVAVRGAIVYGSFDGQRNLRAEPAGASEIDLGQTLLATARVADSPVQLNVSVPIVETLRAVEGTNDAGGGLGDVALSMRWDVLGDARDPVVPDIAPLLSVTVPSGTSADLATGPLGADATGLGSAQLGAGLSLEKTFGRALFALTGSASFYGARTVHGVHSQLGPELTGTLAASYTFRRGFSLGGAFTYSGSWDARVGDAAVPSSARGDTEFAVVAAVPLPGDARVLGSLFFVPPLASVAANELGTVGLSLTLIYAFASDGGGCAGGVCHPP